MNKVLQGRLGNIYILVIGFSVFPLLYISILSIEKAIISELLFWIALEIAADLKPFRIRFKVNMDMTISFVIQLAALIILGIWQALLTIIIATVIVEVLMKKSWKKVLFNAGQYGLSIIAAGIIFSVLKFSPQNVYFDIITDLPAILLSATAYYLFNTFFVSAVLSLTTGCKFYNVFRKDIILNAGFFYSLALIGIAIVLLYTRDRPYIVLVLLFPVLITDNALRKYYSLNHEARETLKVLASTLDERDKYTSFHSAHVSEYAKKIAEHMALSFDDINDIETAGYVHDLGKVSIADNVLNKNGRLTDEEYELIKSHPATAYRLLKNIKPYQKCAEYVLHHHERFDGNGYPSKIAGKKIPLGARILAVADSYDAMTTDRPYRKALSRETAVKELKQNSGTQFDSEVVEGFIAVLKNDYGYLGE